MTKRAELNNAVDYLRYQIGSLKSCKRSEVENEARLVIDAMNAVKAVQPGVGGKALDRALNWIDQGMCIVRQRREA